MTIPTPDADSAAKMVSRSVICGVKLLTKALFIFGSLCGTPNALLAATVPKEVLAFYYGWYGNPQVSGRWVHWREVDPAKKQIGGVTHYPALGAYDSHDPKVVEEHCREAKEAGLTGFIATWWGQHDFHDQGLPPLLDAAAKHGLKVTVYYETAKPRGAPEPAGAVKDILYLLEHYAGQPAWLRVDGKPVVFVYGRAVNELKLAGWQSVIDEVRQKYPAGVVFVGDQLSAKAAQVFDGIHTYNVTGRTQGMSVDQLRAWARENYPKAVRTAGNKISCVTIIPGYDDSHLPERAAPRPITDRHEGQTYRVLWEEAIAAQPNWVLITSWNEWHEGSEIEPSAENGERELKTTKEYTRRFLGQRLSWTPEQAQAVAVRLANERANASYHCQPFTADHPAQFSRGRWVWSDRKGYSLGDLEATVELGEDGVTNVSVRLLDSRLNPIR